ncbi:metallophosphoesterase [candidate division WOR-3 bacterium]|nr:metallophosphoesterase [candidate division WOR-3 bacterium]
MKLAYIFFVLSLYSLEIGSLSFVHGPRISSVFRDSVFIIAETDALCSLKVLYGEENGAMSETVYCSTPDTFHLAVLRDFTGARTWKYSVTAFNAQDSALTPVRTFRMPANPGETFSFAVFGDAHCTAGSGGISPALTANVINMVSYDPDFVVFLGDAVHNSYYQSEVREQWDNFKAATDTLAYNRPVFMTIGNHDVNTWYHNFNGGDILVDEFEMPHNSPVPQFYDELVYYFDWGDARVFILDSDCYDNPEVIDIYQRNWLEQNLSGISSRFKISAHHEHAWSYAGDEYGFLGEHVTERDAYWKVLRDYGVILDMAGHIHLYNSDFFGRILPDTITCVRQLISGGGGGSIVQGHFGNFHHFCLIEVRQNSLNVTVIDTSGAVRDNFVMTCVEEGEPVLGDDFNRVQTFLGGFRFYAEENGNLSVLDQSGRVVFREAVLEGRWAEFSNFRPGVYFILFNSPSRTVSCKTTVVK